MRSNHRVHELDALEFVLELIESQRVEHLSHHESRLGDDLFRIGLRGVVAVARAAQGHDEDAVGAKAQHRRKRCVHAQAPIHVVAVADANGGEQERDRCRSPHVAGRDAARDRLGVRVVVPGVGVCTQAVHEYGDATRAHLGAGDAERAAAAAAEIAIEVLPGDAVFDDALEGGHVHKATDHLTSAGYPSARAAPEPQRAQRHAEQVAPPEGEYIAHRHGRPSLSELARPVLCIHMGARQGVGGMDRPDRSARDDIELEAGEFGVDSLVEIGEGTGFVCAACPAPGKNQPCPHVRDSSEGRARVNCRPPGRRRSATTRRVLRPGRGSRRSRAFASRHGTGWFARRCPRRRTRFSGLHR